MERKELVNGIKDTFKALTEQLVSAMNVLRSSMTERVSQIAILREELREDNEAVTDIIGAVDDFCNDFDEISTDMDDMASSVEYLLDILDDIPLTLNAEDEDEDTSDDTLDFSDYDDEEGDEVYSD